ncbi:hypothetical protein HPP92_008067 [Vanilla planifolia]|uniref:Uncharacterized protein n=1 Tax=Vanilla planifolia TaxID=51239 RepID=A0A835RHP3_VANPL|nr:hypothetical protein HPP92_008067 [Vanilla planifolia]
MESAGRGRPRLPEVVPAERLREKGQMLRVMFSSAEVPPLPLLRSFFLSLCLCFSLSFSSCFLSPMALNKSFHRLEPDVGADKEVERMVEGGGSAGGWCGGEGVFSGGVSSPEGPERGMEIRSSGRITPWRKSSSAEWRSCVGPERFLTIQNSNSGEEDELLLLLLGDSADSIITLQWKKREQSL